MNSVEMVDPVELFPIAGSAWRSWWWVAQHAGTIKRRACALSEESPVSQTVGTTARVV